MQSRMLVGALTVASLAVGAGVGGSASDPVRRWAAINLMETTSIAGAFISGPVIFVHDDERMARGEPCTGVYRYDREKGIGEELVSFHCKPRWGKAPANFTAATTRTSATDPRILTEYQFAGDAEAHGVPVRPPAH